MKKLIASILGLTLVLSAAIAVSAAPNVSGEVAYKINFQDSADLLQTDVDLAGSLNANTNYKIVLEKADSDISNPVSIDEASFTYKNDLGEIEAGYFEYNPTVMDMMDTRSLDEMKAPVAVKITPNLGEKLNVSVGFQPREEGNFGAGSYQVEADYNFNFATVGLNYQNRKDDEAGLVWQVTAQPLDNLKVYGEFGEEVGSDDQAALVGALLTVDKLSVRGEFDLEDESTADGNGWAAKVGYNFTPNMLAEFQTGSDETSQMRVKYTF